MALALVVPLTSSYWIVKLGAFAIGFGFFGDPVFKKTMNILNSKFPNWKDRLDLTKYDILNVFALPMLIVNTEHC